MDLTFLGARLPLTKTFVMNEGMIHTTPYPHVARVTSYHEQVETLAEFRDQLVKHGALGHCLLKGSLQRPLIEESRAGKSVKGEHAWIMFDFDKVEVPRGTSIDAIIKSHLPECCHDVSCIVQLSPSAWRPDTTTWSGHVFMLLAEPADAAKLRSWFEWINFNTPSLMKGLRLSDSLQSLHWPLDRCVGHDSRLIYIAPPKCIGFTPPTIEAVTLLRKKKPALTIPAFNPIDNVTVRSKINEMRRALGEDEVDYAMTQFEGTELMLRAEECRIEGVKASGDHYIRFNMNGGDSYAYYIDLRNPAIIKNFKGEPFYKTEEVAPELFKALVRTAPKVVAKPPLEDGSEVLAFYATNRAASIKTGIYAPSSRNLRLDDSTLSAANAWLAEFGMVQKGPLAHLDLVFDPTVDVQYVPGIPQLNTFKASEYMMRKPQSIVPAQMREIPPLLNKVMYSMLGSPKPEYYSLFINWLAFIFQTRRKTGTSWVMSGTTGTGKSGFIKWILKPIFGTENVRVVQFSLAFTQFNAFLENALFVVFDEADLKAAENDAELMQKLRHWITDPEIEINQKGVKTYPAKSYANFLLMSNKRNVVEVTADDRRFNICERQESKLQITPNELVRLQNGDELEAFASLLHRWPVDEAMVTHLIDTDMRENMHEQTTSINQLIAERIMDGDLQFLIDKMPSDAEAASAFFNKFNPLSLYKALIDRYAEAAHAGQEIMLTDNDLFVMFRTLIPDPRFFQDSRMWCSRHYKALGITPSQRRVVGNPNKRERGVWITWKLDGPAPIKMRDKVTSIKGGKK